MSEGLGTLLYLGLGWVGALSGYLLYRRFGFAYMRPVLLGGLAYSLGAVLEYARFPVLVSGVVGPHETFHIMVLVGIFAHWVFVRRVAELPGDLKHLAPSSARFQRYSVRRAVSESAPEAVPIPELRDRAQPGLINP